MDRLRTLALILVASSIVSGCVVINLGPNKSETGDDSFANQSSQLYDSLPDIKKCQAGVLKKGVKDGVLNTVNKIRALHGLASVIYDDQYDDEVMKGSLIIAASGQLTHQPQSSEKCYSPEGAKGAKTSNIYGGKISKYLKYYSPDDHVIGWMTDVRNASGKNVGHRRWLLDPFLKKIAFGQVASVMEDGSSTNGAMIRVIWGDHEKIQSPRSENNFVAYPFMDYPQEYFDEKAIISFTALEDRLDKYNNKADYSNVELAIVDEAGNSVSAYDVNGDNKDYGVPNVLQFRMGAVPGRLH